MGAERLENGSIYLLECNYMVAGLDVCYAFADTFYYAGAFVA